MGRTTATVQIVLRADGRLRVASTIYHRDTIEQKSGFVDSWADVERRLLLVTPASERQRRVNTRKQGDDHLNNIKGGLLDYLQLRQITSPVRTKPKARWCCLQWLVNLICVRYGDV